MASDSKAFQNIQEWQGNWTKSLVVFPISQCSVRMKDISLPQARIGFVPDYPCTGLYQVLGSAATVIENMEMDVLQLPSWQFDLPSKGLYLNRSSKSSTLRLLQNHKSS